MALSVIGAGWGRTGTLSLKLALERLGFGPCYHTVEAYGHPELIPFLERVADGAAVDWDALFNGYLSAVDWPPWDLVRNPGMVSSETIYGVRRFHRIVFQRCVRCLPILSESFKKLGQPRLPSQSATRLEHQYL